MIIGIKGKYVEGEMARFQRSQSFSVEKGQAKGDYLSNREGWKRKKWGIIGGYDVELRGNVGKDGGGWRRVREWKEFCQRMF